MKFIPIWLAAFGLAAVVQGCAPQGTAGAVLAPGEKLQITQEVWDEYQAYVKRGTELGPDRNGAFGVAIVGDVGVEGLWTYTYCPREYSSCGMRGNNALTDILDACRKEDVECIILARNDEINVPYEIVK